MRMSSPYTLIIAEAGVNHNGDLNMAKALIDAAADAGADLVKFQTFKASQLVTADAQKAAYQQNNSRRDESQFAMLQKLELDAAAHQALIAHCAERDIGFFSTAFDPDSLDLLIHLGQTLFKIPSGEITNLPYLRAIGQRQQPVLLSTGMSTLGDVEAAINALEQAGTSRDFITLLHCTTEYPTPLAEVNLRAMVTMGAALGCAYGYSDHTEGTEVAIAAVALGACVIEKHFTLDRNLPGPDHQASLEPHALKTMIAGIRAIEQALGDGIKRPTASELLNRPVARKSIVAAGPITAGEIFTLNNLAIKRPGTGISPMRWDEILGQTARRSYAPDEMIDG